MDLLPRTAGGFAEIARLLSSLAEIEKEHEAQHRELREDVQTCPVWQHPQAYFEVVTDGFDGLYRHAAKLMGSAEQLP